MSLTKFPFTPVLLVDDEEQFLLSVNFTLSASGINNVIECKDSRDVIRLLSSQEVGVIVLDLSMPHVSGFDLLKEITEDHPDIPTIIITAANEIETAVNCMKAGAFDYLVKPVDDSHLVTCIKRAVEMREMRKENTLLKQYLLNDNLDHPEAFTDTITKNNGMKAIFQYVEAIANTSLPVLITGQTGVGKELISKAIHDLSNKKGEFIPVNIAGVDDNLFSDTIFGHVKGGFTGAEKDRKGLIEQAAGGTLFLDEIGDLSMESQVKLLRLIQEKKYYPIGSDVPKLSNARIIVATHCDIKSMQESGQFRKDLYYRLQVHNIYIPPLSRRREDIPLLTEHFLQKASEMLGKNKPAVPHELFTLLCTYNFPGNVRELEGMVFDAVSRHKSGVLSMKTFKEKIIYRDSGQNEFQAYNKEAAPPSEKGVLFSDQLPALKELEGILISEALRRSNENQTIAAQLLGMTRTALNNRLIRSRKA